MVNRFIILILSALCISGGFFSAVAKNAKNDYVPFLLVSVDKDHTVEGERLIYEVTLYSSDPDVAGSELIANPTFSTLTFARSAPDSHLDRKILDGREYYTAVIDRFFLGTNVKGKYKLEGGKYRIGYNRRVQVDDPIWGPGVATTIETVDLDAPDLKIKVDPLPEIGRDASFSGAVGKFEVETELHSEALAGEEICLLVTVSGLGDLTNARIPDVTKAFGEGLEFKSMTETRDHFINKGRLGSEMELKCVFVAKKPGKYTIKPVEFTFFDSEDRKYSIASSSPLVIEVMQNEDTPASEPPVLHDI